MVCNYIEQIKRFCSIAGKDKLLVQGAGGNASWKEKDKMWIKASGTWLSDALEKDIFVPVDLIHLKMAISKKNFDVTPVVLDGHKLRPSIETILHALMPHDIVVHLHAVEVLSYLVRENYLEDFVSKIPTEVTWVNVEYARPGEELAQGVYDALKSAPQVDVIFLQNHGIVIGANSIEKIEQILTKLLDSLKVNYVEPELIEQELLPISTNNYISYAPIQNIRVQQLVLNKQLFERLEDNWAMYPDHVVFLGAKPIIFQNIYEVSQLDKAQEQLPQLIFIQNVGLFTKDEVTPAITEQLECFYEVLKRQNENHKIKSLSHQQILCLLNWEAEEYRRNIAH